MCIKPSNSSQKRINGKKRELARKQAEHAARQAANLQTQIAPTETIRPPNRLQSLLVSSRINNYCQQINQFTDDRVSLIILITCLKYISRLAAISLIGTEPLHLFPIHCIHPHFITNI